MAGSNSVVDQGAASIVSGTFSPGNQTAAQIQTASAPCKRVRLIAPVDSSGAAQNTTPVFFGDSTAQRDWIAIDGSRDCYIHVDNANKVYAKLGTNSDKLYFRIEN